MMLVCREISETWGIHHLDFVVQFTSARTSFAILESWLTSCTYNPDSRASLFCTQKKISYKEGQPLMHELEGARVSKREGK